MVADRTAVMSLLRPHPYCQRGVVMMPIDEMTLQDRTNCAATAPPRNSQRIGARRTESGARGFGAGSTTLTRSGAGSQQAEIPSILVKLL